MDRLQATIRGTVQGVGFRFFVVRRAMNMGLSGYAKNKRDATVEVWAEGSRADLELLVEALEDGPPASRVQSVDVEWTRDKKRKFDAFTIKH